MAGVTAEGGTKAKLTGTLLWRVFEQILDKQKIKLTLFTLGVERLTLTRKSQ